MTAVYTVELAWINWALFVSTQMAYTLNASAFWNIDASLTESKILLYRV